MALNELLRSDELTWLRTSGTDSDVVLTSRIRLARNFRQVPFPNRADMNQLAAVQVAVDKLMPGLGEALGVAFDRVDMERLTPLQQAVLIEKQLLSRNFVRNPQHRVAYISQDQQVSLMVNEEDHLRIQCMTAGLDLEHPFAAASRIDDLFESQVDIAFDEKMGYLTSCPTNLGTGLRASVLLHLPGLVATRNISSIVNISPQLGLAVRPLSGDEKESESVGCLFQIANQLTLGFSEEEILGNLKSAVQEIVTHEREARKALSVYMKDALEDEVWRAYGTLRYARSLSEKEALTLLSKVRLGIDLRIIGEVTAQCFPQILIGSRRSYLQNYVENENLSKNEIDRLRAERVRTVLERCSTAAER
jgi:protein arginine kinase